MRVTGGVGEHISLAIRVSQVPEHISPEKGVFPGGRTHITWHMCFPGRATHITSDACFPGRGTHVTRNMCFPGRGT